MKMVQQWKHVCRVALVANPKVNKTYCDSLNSWLAHSVQFNQRKDENMDKKSDGGKHHSSADYADA